MTAHNAPKAKRFHGVLRSGSRVLTYAESPEWPTNNKNTWSAIDIRVRVNVINVARFRFLKTAKYFLEKKLSLNFEFSITETFDDDQIGVL